MTTIRQLYCLQAQCEVIVMLGHIFAGMSYLATLKKDRVAV